MIRKATVTDIELIEDTYKEHFIHETENEAFTVFKEGVYPTAKDAEKAIYSGTLYVYEEKNNIVGSIIVDNVQPEEYAGIAWGQTLESKDVMVIHMLLVRPSMAGKGIATSLITYAAGLAIKNSCKALRLDTGAQNIPAVSLYKKLGFQIAANGSMKVGRAIEHKNHLFLEKVL